MGCLPHPSTGDSDFATIHRIPRLFTRSPINGKSRILKWRYISTIFLAIFCGDITLHRPKKIGLIYGIGTSNESLPVAWPLIQGFPNDFFGISGHPLKQRPGSTVQRANGPASATCMVLAKRWVGPLGTCASSLYIYWLVVLTTLKHININININIYIYTYIYNYIYNYIYT
jgi:hypothetical protein